MMTRLGKYGRKRAYKGVMFTCIFIASELSGLDSRATHIAECTTGLGVVGMLPIGCFIVYQASSDQPRRLESRQIPAKQSG